ncbi:hypothetical protein [Dactylosporangium sp. NPDC049140]|uniref:hypothetical protein n=1 Tax=Dactylosporangium sp. NPDC049140 TaxID=3155647 RepID=UPI0033F3804D
MTYVAPTFLDGQPYPAAVWQAIAGEVARMSPVASASIPQVASSLSSSSAIATTATAVLTPSNCVFSAGRAYSVENLGGIFGDAAGRLADFLSLQNVDGWHPGRASIGRGRARAVSRRAATGSSSSAAAPPPA